MRISEAGIIEGYGFYQYATCGKRLKSLYGLDTAIAGGPIIPLALLFGNLDGANAAHKKLLTSWEEAGVAETGDYGSDFTSIEASQYSQNISPLWLILGRDAQAYAALKAIGFTAGPSAKRQH